jgi:hypothetical protein
VPSAALLATVPLVRKQDFGPRLLRRLWKEHGRDAGRTDAGSRAGGGRSG